MQMPNKELLGFLSLILCFAGYWTYIASVLKGRTKPHLFTWVIWAIIMSIVFVAQSIQGAGPGSWVLGLSALGCLMIAVLAAKYGEKRITRSDWVLFVAALMTIPMWLFTHNPLGSVLLATFIDGCAYYPTFRKAWGKPQEESFFIYAIDVPKWIIAFFALTDYSFVTLFYPVFVFVINTLLAIMIVYRRMTLKPASFKTSMVVCLALAMLGLTMNPALAETKPNDNAAYVVTDVPVDVKADSATHAREQAITEAQRTALATLLDRFSVDPSMAAKLKAEDLATLVQNFEVQSERASSVRYIGTFTVQFRPNAVRKFLGSKNVAVSDTRSASILVLPVFVSAGRPILWEETTRWRSVWDKGSHDDGLVPVVLPAGGLDDIAMLSTEEASLGKSEGLKAISAKYQAGGIAVAILNGSPDATASGYKIDLTRYDGEGHSLSVDHLTLPAIADKNAVDAGLADGMRQVRRQLEKDWLQDQKQPQPAATPVTENDGQGVSVSNALPEYAPPTQPPMLHLPVTVPVGTLAEWAQIHGILNGTPGVGYVDVITIGRGVVMIEMDLSTSIFEVQAALAQQRLQLDQDYQTKNWFLRRL
jgi:hypothetical protein